ncbi:hypothetical protein CH333_04000 [candidate division WOR-3 bacterium JGI_Cruoil_03_44_89]|uniref:Metallo-beta-lactamase domain-containing protein n=1 Tax=candidate division WOR-3 bacterium JGI_Cruoil_03_44_89 TaxID=1973748 RepID=A0A235BVE8_UNCW3|nr:MAG: hypothetical protein CH333_04000 [candidate division WOR-3 bacterium JGI_Cruoil_03_44_89]
MIILNEIKIKPIFFDSMGAKCSSVLIETPDIRILVDPGAAGMQRSYPLPPEEKERLRLEALKRIGVASESCDFIFISHYHYDHHTLPSNIPEGVANFYMNKTIWAKDPNRYINHSQWRRARKFFEELGGEGIYIKPGEVYYKPIEEELPFALSRDYGDYTQRKRELLKKGEMWFKKLLTVWQTESWVKEFSTPDCTVEFIDGREYNFGSTKIRFTEPLFHGIEYDRVGWVVSLVVERNGKKFIYSSDLQGPQIEDYAEWIIDENPDAMVLDGPATYLFGYMMNRINLNRAIDNIMEILKRTKTNPIIYDHHLLRERRYKERLSRVYEEGKSRVLTAAELLGKEPLILTMV